MNLNKNYLRQNLNSSNKKLNEQIMILKLIAKSNTPLTIPEISEKLLLSVPTITSSVSDLIEDRWVTTGGKKKTTQGRKPTMYKVNSNAFYIVGVKIGFKELVVIYTDINMKLIEQKRLKNFKLNDNEQCLNQIVNFIKSTLQENKLDNKNVLGIGIGMTGRVNKFSGGSNSFFKFAGPSLEDFFSEKLNIEVFLENDTRVAGVTEKEYGVSKNSPNCLFVNIDEGLGLSIIINNQVVTGTNGYAGEFGHMKFGKKKRTCICGKVGCLGTEVSGFALKLDLEEKLKEGIQSNNFKKGDKPEYEDIVLAATKGDFLAIEIIQQQGEILGKSLGDIVNLISPDEIVIGGKVKDSRNIFLDSVKMGLNSSVLPDVFDTNKVYLSNIKDEKRLAGLSCLVLKEYNLY